MRIPYVPQNPHTKDQDEAEILSRVLARRGSHGLLPLDRALLHSFPLADAWNTFLGAIRSKTTLSTALRALIICRVAVLNEAGFEWDHHAPILVETGFPKQSLELLNTPDLKQLSTDNQAFSASDLAALHYTDEMTKKVKVSRDTFAQLKEHFNDREIVEITATVGAYNCVSRFLVALDVDERNNA